MPNLSAIHPLFHVLQLREYFCFLVAHLLSLFRHHTTTLEHTVQLHAWVGTVWNKIT